MLEVRKENDLKKILVDENGTTIINYPDGYKITIPSKNVKYNFDNDVYVCKYNFDNSILTASYENKNPYVYQGKKGMNIYFNEWLVRYVNNEEFLKANHISHTKDNTNDVVGDYNVISFSLFIENEGNIEYPYYNIGIIKREDSICDFYLFVMKSKVNSNDAFEKLLSSFSLTEKSGKNALRNQVKEMPNVNFNEETLAYYNKLLKQDTVDWGVFRKCIVDKTDGAYEYQKNYYENNHDYYDKLLNHNFELLPTYMHISWNGNYNYFPLEMANQYAGGNGFNGKKVLHFTMQFTTDNNKMGACYNPTFDLMRGKFDEYFHRLARDIKAYKHPVLFRLNNEMNTDWTSYSGIMGLLDPDIFKMNWKRLYDIFKEEGVDNCIWIFNPIAITTPYCSWGEFINYYPDGMVNIIGLTSYERGNEENYNNFNDMYTYLLNEYDVFFKKFPKVISEFGAGSGGEVLYNYGKGCWDSKEVYRNQYKQAKFVKDMFEDLKTNELFKEIKGAIWFSCNDYGKDNKIMNNFNITENLVDTIDAFKKGFKTV